MQLSSFNLLLIVGAVVVVITIVQLKDHGLLVPEGYCETQQQQRGR